MKIQHIKAIAVVALIALIAVAPIAKADDLTVGGSNTTGADSGLSTGGSNTTGADSNTSTSGSNLSTGGSNTTGADSGLSTGGSNTTGADSNTSTSGSGLTTGGSNTTGADATAPSNNNNNNGGSSSTGGSSSSSSGSSSSFSGGSVLVSGSVSLPVLNNVGQCDYIKDYLKISWNNSTTEVNKLQSFLKDVEKLDVDVTGNFDQKTFDAVKAFQAKYVNDVMQPWGVTTPTGEVYYTTKKKINEIYCRTTFTLTPAQLAQIEAYRTSLQNGGAQAGELNLSNESVTGTSTTPGSQEVGQATSTNTSQTAAAANNTSFWGKLWSFIKHIFGR